LSNKKIGKLLSETQAGGAGEAGEAMRRWTERERRRADFWQESSDFGLIFGCSKDVWAANKGLPKSTAKNAAG
jgi:hypothetical protein